MKLVFIFAMLVLNIYGMEEKKEDKPIPPHAPLMQSRRLGPSALTINIYEGDEDIPGRLSPSVLRRPIDPERCRKAKLVATYLACSIGLLGAGGGVGAALAIHFAHC